MADFSVRKAVITAAGRGVRVAPAADPVQKAMLPFVDRDGLSKPAIQIIAEEALDSGIEEVLIVCAPGDEERYCRLFAQMRENLETAFEGVVWAEREVERLENLMRRLSFAVQEESLGYGHAVLCARAFTGNEPFLAMLGDHLYVSSDARRRCARQLIELAESQHTAVSAVQATHEALLARFGTVAGQRVQDLPGTYKVERVREKPSVSVAELELQTPGLRAGHYLCFFGMHVLTGSIFPLIEEDLAASQGQPVTLSPALGALARRERCLALELAGRRHDIGSRFGILEAQLALALAGDDRAEALAVVVDVMAQSGLGAGR